MNGSRQIRKVMQFLRCFRKIDSRAQTLVEYALILAFISIVAIVVLASLGSKVTSVFSTTTSIVSQAANFGS